jgi:hypothetical protein
MGARRRRLNQQLAAGEAITGRGEARGVNWLDLPPPPKTHGLERPRPAGPALNPAIPLVATVAGCLLVAWLVLRAVAGG